MEVHPILRRRSLSTTALVWAALLLAPVLFLVETSGPRWLNLTLRGLWVALVAIVAVQVALGWRRASTRSAPQNEAAR